jgi:hypothetical protein
VGAVAHLRPELDRDGAQQGRGDGRAERRHGPLAARPRRRARAAAAGDRGEEDEATAAIAALKQQDDALAERQRELKAQVEGLLPDWVKGFVTPAELARTYPLVLAALALLIAALALLVRHHFVACRDFVYPNDQSRRDPALASCFTLVFRGWRGTLWTLLAVGALTFTWWYFTSLGLAQATRLWGDGFLGPNPIARRWLAPVGWLLWIVPCLAGAGVVAMLVDARTAAKGAQTT